MTRNYSADFAEAFAAFAPEGEYISSVVAAKFCEHLRKTDMDLFTGWLTTSAEIFVCNWIGQSQRHSRARAANRLAATAFGAAAEALEDQPSKALFETSYCISAKTWKPLGQMTGDDHRHVASEYDTRAQTNAMLAAFHKAVARKVGKRTTAEALTEDAYLALRDSILKPAATSAA